MFTEPPRTPATPHRSSIQCWPSPSCSVPLPAGANPLAGVFKVEPATFALPPGEGCHLKVLFCPSDAKTYECKIPAFLGDNTTEPYIFMEACGKVRKHRTTALALCLLLSLSRRQLLIQSSRPCPVTIAILSSAPPNCKRNHAPQTYRPSATTTGHRRVTTRASPSTCASACCRPCRWAWSAAPCSTSSTRAMTTWRLRTSCRRTPTRSRSRSGAATLMIVPFSFHISSISLHGDLWRVCTP